MCVITINGSFLCRNLTGIERFAYEVTKRLDKMLPPDRVCIYVPANAANVPFYKNIKVVSSTSECTCFPLWDHVIFSAFVKKSKTLSLSFANITPFLNPGIVVLHDIYCKLYPHDFSSLRDKLIKWYSCAMYRYAVRHAKLLLTVSDFSKKQIAQTYKINANRIPVIYNGWDHFKDIVPDFSVIEQNTKLSVPFYFTLGSLSKRKNLRWISDYAEKHPDETFAISGKMLSGLVPEELANLQKLPNVVLLGYVSDAQVKALMIKCRAFVFPSYYEGFGIPPLEALSVETPVVVSKSASLPEIYGNCAHYINPDFTGVSLSSLLEEPVDNPSVILEKYTYQNAAEKLLPLLDSAVKGACTCV